MWYAYTLMQVLTAHWSWAVRRETARRLGSIARIISDSWASC